MRRFDWPRRALLGACVLFLPMFAYAETSSWSAWLASQIQQHPEVLAAREQLLGSNASADALLSPAQPSAMDAKDAPSVGMVFLHLDYLDTICQRVVTLVTGKAGC